MLAAGSVLVEGGAIPPEVLAAGAPAVVKKPLSGSAAAWSEGAAAAYQRYRERYLAHSRLTEVDEFETMG
jgi:carbonic anhydrase/acetyltransferase-like protein (isoleucine patch superfamily)